MEDPVESVKYCSLSKGLTVKSKKKIQTYDYVISALPSFALANVIDSTLLRGELNEEIVKTLRDVTYADMTTMNIGFKKDHPYTGHMLTPSERLQENKGVLGVLSMHCYP
jgi:protoporphyrinogen oxidase